MYIFGGDNNYSSFNDLHMLQLSAITLKYEPQTPIQPESMSPTPGSSETSKQSQQESKEESKSTPVPISALSLPMNYSSLESEGQREQSDYEYNFHGREQAKRVQRNEDRKNL